MDKHYIGPVGRSTGSQSAIFRKIARLVGRLGSAPFLLRRIGSGPRLVGRLRPGPRLVNRIGSGVRVSASFQKKNIRLVGRLGSGPRLVADRADVVLIDALKYKLPN